ncbi:MAG TPA: hypothetical protein DEP35_23480 [Deltaproteobacteria bacterium]|nr:hypothetical protein [Deltaproteobacteria bacterium]
MARATFEFSLGQENSKTPWIGAGLRLRSGGVSEPAKQERAHARERGCLRDASVTEEVWPFADRAAAAPKRCACRRLHERAPAGDAAANCRPSPLEVDTDPVQAERLAEVFSGRSLAKERTYLFGTRPL